MMDVLNCPNCGAPITGDKCEYCGAVFYDWATIKQDKPSYIKMEMDGKIIMFRARMTDLSMEMTPGEMIFYADGKANFVSSGFYDATVRAEFDVVRNKNGELFMIIKETGKGDENTPLADDDSIYG